jgi:hypothetical protein
VGDRQGQIPGERRVRLGRKSKTKKPVCVYLITFQDMAHRTDFPEYKGSRATNLNGDIPVYMPWCYFRAPVSTLQHQTEDGGMDLNNVAAKYREVFLRKLWSQRDRSGSLTAEWLSVWASLLPKTKPSPCTYECSLGPRNTCEFIFTNGPIWNPRGNPKQGGLLNEVYIAPCELCLLR